MIKSFRSLNDILRVFIGIAAWIGVFVAINSATSEPSGDLISGLLTLWTFLGCLSLSFIIGPYGTLGFTLTFPIALVYLLISLYCGGEHGSGCEEQASSEGMTVLVAVGIYSVVIMPLAFLGEYFAIRDVKCKQLIKVLIGVGLATTVILIVLAATGNFISPG